MLILLLATALRCYCLDSVPPGLTHDEAGHGHDAAAILAGARPIYQTVGYGREPLYDYLLAGAMALLGPTDFTLRLAAASLGLLTLAVTFAWARRAFDAPTALLATALQAASFWSLSTARQVLRSGLLPTLFVLAAYFFWDLLYAPGTRRGSRHWPLHPDRVPRPAWASAVLCGLCVGAMLYTYLPARVLWVVFPAFLLYLALWQRAAFRRAWLPVLFALLLGLLLAVPLFAYLRAHPGAEQRLGMLDAPLQALWAGDVSALLERVGSALAGLFVPGRGDDFLAYTLPGRPLFDPLTGALFLAGVGLCLARWRDPACAFALLWFALGFAPTLVTGAPASTTRSIAALPVAFLFPALALLAGARWISARWGRRTVWASGLVCAGLVAVSGVSSARDYFLLWGESPDVRAAYQHTLVEVGRYLDRQAGGGTVVLSSVYPGAPHDPYVLELSLRRDDLSLRWCDGRRALLLPGAAQARLIVPSSAALDAAFAGLPGLRLRERVALRPDDLDPGFAVYDWQPQVTLAALQEQLDASAGVLADVALPADFGGVQLLGAGLRPPRVAPGGTVELLTLWRVTDPQALRLPDQADAALDLVLFTHALNADGTLAGQEDRLDAPAWDWQPGDVVAQVHRFDLPAGLPPGQVTLEVGVYHRATLTRLPLRIDGVVAGDRVLLSPVEVAAP